MRLQQPPLLVLRRRKVSSDLYLCLLHSLHVSHSYLCCIVHHCHLAHHSFSNPHPASFSPASSGDFPWRSPCQYERLRLSQDPSSLAFPFFPLLHQQYGPVSFLCVGPFPHLLLLDPALIRALFVSHSSTFHKPAVMKTVLGVFGRGLVTADGLKWAAHRRLVNPAFQPSPLKVAGGRRRGGGGVLSLMRGERERQGVSGR